MHMLGGHKGAGKRGSLAREDGHISAPRQTRYNAGIALGKGQGDIARNGHHAQHIKRLRAGQSQQNGHGIILAWICINDDFACHVVLILALRHCG
jgi:hypothetical protein